jgi:putative endonuclease
VIIEVCLQRTSSRSLAALRDDKIGDRDPWRALCAQTPALSFRPKGEIGLTKIFKNPYNQRQTVSSAAVSSAAVSSAADPPLHYKMVKNSCWVYILSNTFGTLYVGVTNNLLRRMAEHKAHEIDGFTKTYKIDRLMYMEETDNISAAITREKEIKKWNRKKKLDLIRKINPKFDDLSEGWF